MAEIVLFVLGALLGLGTGFFFERRAKNSARLDNSNLRRQLETVKDEVQRLQNALYNQRYDVVPNIGASAGRPTLRLRPSVVLDRVRRTQDGNGSTNRKELIVHFLAEGHPAKDVDSAIDELCKSGELSADGSSLRLL